MELFPFDEFVCPKIQFFHWIFTIFWHNGNHLIVQHVFQQTNASIKFDGVIALWWICLSQNSICNNFAIFHPIFTIFWHNGNRLIVQHILQQMNASIKFDGVISLWWICLSQNSICNNLAIFYRIFTIFWHNGHYLIVQHILQQINASIKFDGVIALW